MNVDKLVKWSKEAGYDLDPKQAKVLLISNPALMEKLLQFQFNPKIHKKTFTNIQLDQLSVDGFEDYNILQRELEELKDKKEKLMDLYHLKIKLSKTLKHLLEWMPKTITVSESSKNASPVAKQVEQYFSTIKDERLSNMTRVHETINLKKQQLRIKEMKSKLTGPVRDTEALVAMKDYLTNCILKQNKALQLLQDYDDLYELHLEEQRLQKDLKIVKSRVLELIQELLLAVEEQSMILDLYASKRYFGSALSLSEYDELFSNSSSSSSTKSVFESFKTRQLQTLNTLNIYQKKVQHTKPLPDPLKAVMKSLGYCPSTKPDQFKKHVEEMVFDLQSYLKSSREYQSLHQTSLLYDQEFQTFYASFIQREAVLEDVLSKGRGIFDGKEMEGVKKVKEEIWNMEKVVGELDEMEELFEVLGNRYQGIK